MSSEPGVTEVEVLLATYNGARFLAEQIDSILRQKGSLRQEDFSLRITARDDGSSDHTRAILKEYAEHFPDVFRVLPQSESTGSAKDNFLRLMQLASAPYVCFSDQDDVWVEDKVARSLGAMHELENRLGAGRPLLVFSDLKVVDESLRISADSYWRKMEIEPRAALRLETLIGQSVVTGCTVMVNRRMVELARSMPPEAIMHDRWMGLLAAAMGGATIVKTPTVLYRQHGANVIGAVAPDGSVAAIAGRAADSRGRRTERIRSELQAEALLRVHRSDMPTRAVKLLQAYLQSGRSDSAFERVWLTVRHGFYRGGMLKSAATVFDLVRAKSDAS